MKEITEEKQKKIIKDNKIIGAVTHVVIDNPLTGYGILITNMLEEGEKVLNYSNN